MNGTRSESDLELKSTELGDYRAGLVYSFGLVLLKLDQFLPLLPLLSLPPPLSLLLPRGISW